MAKRVSNLPNRSSNISGGEGTFELGVETWNVAQGYTQIKILKLLIQLDKYDIIAQFGTEDMDMEGYMNEDQITKRRLEGLQRFIATLKLLIGNVRFSIKSKDKPTLDGYLSRVNNVELIVPKMYFEQTNDITKEDSLTIDEKLFGKCLKILQNVKDELNTQINNAGLIFRESEEIDLDKIMSDIERGG